MLVVALVAGAAVLFRAQLRADKRHPAPGLPVGDADTDSAVEASRRVVPTLMAVVAVGAALGAACGFALWLATEHGALGPVTVPICAAAGAAAAFPLAWLLAHNPSVAAAGGQFVHWGTALFVASSAAFVLIGHMHTTPVTDSVAQPAAVVSVTTLPFALAWVLRKGSHRARRNWALLFVLCALFLTAVFLFTK